MVRRTDVSNFRSESNNSIHRLKYQIRDRIWRSRHERQRSFQYALTYQKNKK